MKSKHSKHGFTILEVLAATLIFFLVISAVISTQTRATRAIAESALISQAQALGSLKMTEMEIKYQEAIDKAGIRGALGRDEGSFDAPYATFRWTAELKENPIIIEQEQLLQYLTAFGLSPEDSQAQFEQSKLLLTNLNKALKENMAELVVTVKWDFQKMERSFPLVTHLIPRKPKIKFTQNTDMGGNFSP